MTVKEVLDELSKFDPDMEVHTWDEGWLEPVGFVGITQDERKKPPYDVVGIGA